MPNKFTKKQYSRIVNEWNKLTKKPYNYKSRRLRQEFIEFVDNEVRYTYAYLVPYITIPAFMTMDNMSVSIDF